MPESVDTLLLTIIALLIIVIFGGSIYSFFHAIFLFIFSAGDGEKIKKAWNSIRFMILGILLTLFFLFIFPLIFKRLNLENYESFTATNIFRHTGTLLSGLFSFGREAVTEFNSGGGPQIYPGPINNPSRSSNTTSSSRNGSSNLGGEIEQGELLEL